MAKKKSNKTVLGEAGRTRSIINTTGTCQTIFFFFAHVLRREKLDYFATAGMVQGEDREKPKMLGGLTK